MDPLSFSAAFLLSREPITHPKMVESPSAVIRAPAERVPGELQATPRPVREVKPTDVPPTLNGPPEGHQDHLEAKQEKTEEKEKVSLDKTDLDQRHAKWLGRTKSPVLLNPHPPRTAPAAWHLIDRFGVTWTHSDKTYLEQFVATRNATVLVTPPVTNFGYSCSNGRCAR